MAIMGIWKYLLLLLALSSTASISVHTTLISKDRTTAKDIIDHFQPDLRGKVALVTGGNSGIGTETVKALCAAGAKVILCSRKLENGIEVVENFVKRENTSGYSVPHAQVEVKQLDLADLDSIKRLADEVNAKESHIDFLVLNAGVMACPLSYTKQGFETQIGTNHFGHHYLTSLMLPKVRRCYGRVVVVSSNAHKAARLNIDDLHFKKGKYSPWTAYANSKMANILFAKSLSDKGISAFSVHPGVILTNLQQHINKWPFVKQILPLAFRLGFGKTLAQGAATTVFACVSPDIAHLSGSYLQDCRISEPNRMAQDRTGRRRGKLWETTEAQIRQALSRMPLYP